MTPDYSHTPAGSKPNEAHVETCGAGYSEYAMCDSPEACADLRNDPVAEPEPCRYTQPDGTRCSRPGEPKHGMCGPHYWARDDEWRAPVVEPNPVCGARVDYHGGTCGRPVGHDEPCTPVVEPDPRCVRGLPAGNCCERYDTCEPVEPNAACEGCPDPGLPCAGCPAVEPEPCRYTQPDGTRCSRPGEPKHGMCGPHYWARGDEGHDPVVEPERMPCGHSRAAIVSSGEGTSYCGECVEACSPDDYETGPELDAATSAGSMTNLDDASVHYQQGWDAGHTAGIDTGQVDERARIVAIIGPCNDEAWCADVDDCGWCRHGEFLIRQINGGPTDA